MYVDLACHGCETYFDDRVLDPMYASNMKEYNVRMKRMSRAIVEKKMSASSVLPVSQEVKDFFYSCKKSEQRQLLAILQFEFKMYSVKQHKCSICQTKTLGHLFDTKSNIDVCVKCQTLKFKTNKEKTQSYIDKNMLPIWYDDDGLIHYELPDELIGLTHGEKMLLQRIAVTCPIVHIYQGSFGIKGHTCCFRSQSVDQCNTLPRLKADLICMIKETRGLKGIDDVKRTYLHVRKNKVLAALHWLKKHHRGYRDIVIQEDVLPEDDTTVNCTLMQEMCEATDVEDDYGHCSISRTQTTVTGLDMQETGEFLEKNQCKFSKDAYEVVKEIKKHMKDNGKHIPEMDYPQIGVEPIDEYNYPHMFADAYPWLFPGGIGDGPLGQSGAILTRWAQMIIHYGDGRFMRDPFFQFHLLNYVHRHNNNQNGLYFLREFMSEKETSLDDIKKSIENGDISFIKRLQTFSGQKIKGSDAFWRDKKKELDTWIMHHLEAGHGPPTLFLTLSCAELWWPDLKRLLFDIVQNTEDHYLGHEMMNEKDKEGNATKKLVEMYSVVVQEFFQIRLQHWIDTIGKQIFRIKHYYIRYEFAKGRGMIHAHILAITEDNGICVQFYKTYVQDKDSIEATKLLSEYARNQLGLTADLPTVNSANCLDASSKALQSRFCQCKNVTEDLHSLCIDCHIHECNKFCLRTPRNR